MGCSSGTGTRVNSEVDGKVVTTYDDPENGIRVTYPGDWDEINFMKPKGTVLLLAPPNKSGGFPPAVGVVAPRPESVVTSNDLDGMETRTIEKARSDVGDFTLIQTSETTVAGEPARKVVYSGKKLGQAIQVMYVITTHGGRAYAFSYMASPSGFEDNLGAVDRFIGSVQFADRK